MDFDRGANAAVSRVFDQHDGRPETCASAAHSSRQTEHNKTSSNMKTRMNRTQPGITTTKDFKLQELAMMSLSPIFRSIHHWWLQRAERHYLICADVEQQRAREAQMNVAYYQKRAALARSARN
ncbi:MAG TPA: hypothetical protein VGE12_12245 [Noviherbaspirillum sp.]